MRCSCISWTWILNSIQGSILGPILSHMMCNTMGLPDVDCLMFGQAKERSKSDTISLFYFNSPITIHSCTNSKVLAVLWNRNGIVCILYHAIWDSRRFALRTRKIIIIINQTWGKVTWIGSTTSLIYPYLLRSTKSAMLGKWSSCWGAKWLKSQKSRNCVTRQERFW